MSQTAQFLPDTVSHSCFNGMNLGSRNRVNRIPAKPTILMLGVSYDQSTPFPVGNFQ
jgi:hypothetical protein